MRAEEINIRDPYILAYNGRYYLYGTRSETCWGEAYGFDCYVSDDLVDYEGPFEIFRRPEGFFATQNYWAPECYEHNGRFYLLTTFGGDGMKKGIYILESEKPTGPFELKAGRLTPENWTCIDGTLFFDGSRIYLVYSHSFEDTPDADICFQELSQELDRCVSEPQKMFAAKDAPWAKPVPFAEAEFGLKGDVYFSDGPCVFNGEDGNLYMTWSSWSKGSYAVGIARSLDGTISGAWEQIDEPLWKENGGHGMVFKNFEGKYYFCLHYPNDKTKEHPYIVELLFEDGKISLHC